MDRRLRICAGGRQAAACLGAMGLPGLRPGAHLHAVPAFAHGATRARFRGSRPAAHGGCAPRKRAALPRLRRDRLGLDVGAGRESVLRLVLGSRHAPEPGAGAAAGQLGAGRAGGGPERPGAAADDCRDDRSAGVPQPGLRPLQSGRHDVTSGSAGRRVSRAIASLAIAVSPPMSPPRSRPACAWPTPSRRCRQASCCSTARIG